MKRQNAGMPRKSVSRIFPARYHLYLSPAAAVRNKAKGQIKRREIYRSVRGSSGLWGAVVAVLPR